MDKLRAMQYFNRAVEGGSFTAAAKSLEVSIPAVTQLVAALERSLGIALLHRTPRGLSLTPDGERCCEPPRGLVVAPRRARYKAARDVDSRNASCRGPVLRDAADRTLPRALPRHRDRHQTVAIDAGFRCGEPRRRRAHRLAGRARARRAASRTDAAFGLRFARVLDAS